MITSRDLQLWTEEGAPALRGASLHRVWREADDWVFLFRHHVEGDPERRAVRRVALEVCLDPNFARAVVLPAEEVNADDNKAKKVQGRDSHPFLAALRKQLQGTRVEELAAVPGERILLLDLLRTAQDPEVSGPPQLRLAIELLGRTGNLILSHLSPDDNVYRCVGSLHAGRSHRPFTPGRRYRLPPAREAPDIDSQPTLGADVKPSHETLALGVAVATVQRQAAEEARKVSRKAQLERALKKGLERLANVVDKLESQLAETERADSFEQRGDLIKANLDKIPPRAEKVVLLDYSSQPPSEVEVSLDPTKTAQDEMKRLYKRARKLRNGQTSIATRLGESDQRLTDGRGLLEQLHEIDSEDEEGLDRIERAGIKDGLIPKQKAPRAKEQLNQGPRSFRSREGHEILVGRNDDENDRLTMRTARGKDLFFHVRSCPGSHVILRVDPSRPPNHESLLDAATIAVHYSKARNRGAVDVSYTPRKWVKKPKGAKPGLVQISNEKTVRAGSDQERLRRVLNSLRRPGDEEE